MTPTWRYITKLRLLPRVQLLAPATHCSHEVHKHLKITLVVSEIPPTNPLSVYRVGTGMSAVLTAESVVFPPCDLFAWPKHLSMGQCKTDHRKQKRKSNLAVWMLALDMNDVHMYISMWMGIILKMVKFTLGVWCLHRLTNIWISLSP